MIGEFNFMKRFFKMLQIAFKLIVVILSTNAMAEISISASVDKNTVSLNDQVILQVVVSGDVNNLPNPTLPDISDFQVYSSGRSQNISIVNGQVSSTISFNYILSPRRIGDFLIGEIVVNYQGKIYKTQPIQIKVVKDSSSPKQIPVENNVYQGKAKALFIEAMVDKEKAYVNQQITFTLRFFSRVNLLSQPRYQPPDFSGFVVEDLPPQRSYYTTINGQRYYVSEIKTALFPTSPGKYTIGSASLQCVIEDFDMRDFFSDDFFSRFFSSGKEVMLKSNLIEINVLALPQPQPVDMSGSVGRYSLDVSVDRTKVEANQTVMLKIEISGSGNVKSVVFPREQISNVLRNDFVVFDPITSFDIKKENYLVKGKKVFQIPIAPTRAGQIVIPSIKFVYFDPEEKKYVSLFSKPISLEVVPSKNVSVPLVSGEKTFYSKKLSIEDIRYIKLNFKVSKATGGTSFLVQLVPPILFLIFVGVYNYRKSLVSNSEKFRRTVAYKKFKSRISTIKKSKEDNNTKLGLLYDALTNYFADKMNISAERFTIEMFESFYSQKVPQDIIEEFISLWEEINFYRFAKTKTQGMNFNEFLMRVEKIVSKLDYEK